VSWAPLIAVAGAFLVLAASDRVLFNGREIATYHWPWWMRGIAATFHGSGRMVWLMYYVLVVAILWFAIRNLPRRAVAPLLAVGLAVQLADFRAGARVMRTGASQSGMIPPLRDPIWDLIKARYTRLVSVPAWHGQPDRQALGWFAARNGIATNIGYFGRINPERRQPGVRETLDQVLTGHYDRSTVYSFPRVELWNVVRRIASPHDLVTVADGHCLVIPGANRSGTARPDDAAAPPLDTWLAFSAGGAAQPFLIDGWTWPEGWGTWSEGRIGTFLVPLPTGHRGKLRVSLRWIGHARGGQRVEVWFDQAKFTVEFPHDMAERVDSFDVVPNHDWILVETRVSRLTPAKDGRPLGLGLMAIRIGDLEAPAAPSLPEKTL
jgi:hypothetical protein